MNNEEKLWFYLRRIPGHDIVQWVRLNYWWKWIARIIRFQAWYLSASSRNSLLYRNSRRMKETCVCVTKRNFKFAYSATRHANAATFSKFLTIFQSALCMSNFITIFSDSVCFELWLFFFLFVQEGKDKNKMTQDFIKYDWRKVKILASHWSS